MLVDPGQQFIIKLSSIFLELGARQMTQIIICFADQLLRVQERVNEEAAAGDLPRHPAMEA